MDFLSFICLVFVVVENRLVKHYEYAAYSYTTVRLFCFLGLENGVLLALAMLY